MPTTTLTDHYDPDPDAPHATCQNCGVILDDQDAVRAHISTTLDRSTDHRSHTIITTNLTRTQRIRYAIEGIVDDALREDGDMCGRELEFNEDTDANITRRVNDMIRRRDITRDEAEDALRNASANHITVALSEGGHR